MEEGAQRGEGEGGVVWEFFRGIPWMDVPGVTRDV